MFFAAPAKFIGDKRAAYQGILAFDLKQSRTNEFYGREDVRLGSSNLVLSFALGNLPDRTWRTYQVPLNENAGWIVRGAGRLATRDEFISVLKSIDRLWIRAEYTSASVDRSDLDNVWLLGPPSGPMEPVLSAASYAGLSINGAIGQTYRIEYRTVFDPADEWRKLDDVVLPARPYLYIDRSSHGHGQRFYRAVLDR